MLQSAGVNVTDAGDTVPSVRSFDESPIVTLADGGLSSTTVNAAVPPASVVVRPDVGFTETPGARITS